MSVNKLGFFERTGVNTKCFPIPYDEEIDPDFAKVEALRPWERLAQDIPSKMYSFQDAYGTPSEKGTKEIQESARSYEMVDLSDGAPSTKEQAAKSRAERVQDQTQSHDFLENLVKNRPRGVRYAQLLDIDRQPTIKIRAFTDELHDEVVAQRDKIRAQTAAAAAAAAPLLEVEKDVRQRALRGEKVDVQKRLEKLDEEKAPLKPKEKVPAPLIRRVTNLFSSQQQQQRQPVDNEGL